MPEEKKPKLSPQKTKFFEKWVQNVRMEYRPIIEDKLNGIMKYEYIANNNTYLLEVKFNEDRGKFQALVGYEERRQSLSFFSTAKHALENMELYLSLLNGGIQGESKKMVGD